MTPTVRAAAFLILYMALGRPREVTIETRVEGSKGHSLPELGAAACIVLYIGLGRPC